jgi:hypothetical protein
MPKRGKRFNGSCSLRWNPGRENRCEEQNQDREAQQTPIVNTDSIDEAPNQRPDARKHQRTANDPGEHNSHDLMDN